MFGERWDEDEARAPTTSSTEPVRPKVFRGRGRGFLAGREVRTSQSQSKAARSQRTTNGPENSNGSEGGNSGSDNDRGNQDEAARGRDHSLRDTSGHGDSPRNETNTTTNSRFSDDEAERRGDTSQDLNPSRSNASRYPDDEAERRGDTSQDLNPSRSNASRYPDDEAERRGDTSQDLSPSRSNASRYPDDDAERRGDASQDWNPRRSNASRYPDDDAERREDASQDWNPSRSNASRYPDDGPRGYEDSSRNWNPRRSNGSRYPDEPRRYEDSSNDCSRRRDNSPMRRYGRNNNGGGWDRESPWSNDRRGKPPQQQPPREHYIPNPDPENEEDLFSQNIACGINFDRYDDIQVSVTGENIPPKIERFEDAQICNLLMENITKSSYTKPTPVQKHALPIIMSGRDMMACAQTGSGKTAAFLIPTINCILQTGGPLPGHDNRAGAPQLLIVTPTRELAIQIYIEAKKLTYGSSLKTEICYGGTDVKHQLNRVQRGCNILIATCGRLIDFLNRGILTLSKLRHMIIDEADKMLDRGFYEDIETIVRASTTGRKDEPQNLLFSATFPEDVQSLAKLFLKNYIFIAVGIIGAACEDVEQRFFLVHKAEKKSRLISLLERDLKRSKTLVFVQHKRVADIIAAKLSEVGFPATSMHGDREQREREEALRDFRGGKADILVATAVAARGLDIRGINYVINYDLPQTVDEYVHRIGRTGRVGNRGLAISFYDPDTDLSLVPGISKILRLVRKGNQAGSPSSEEE